MAFFGNALGCELPWVRSTYPAGSSVHGDLWQRVLLTAMAIASAAPSPKIIVIIFSLGAVLRKKLVLLLFRSDRYQQASSRRRSNAELDIWTF